MCLVTNNPIPKVADKNIPVWKVVKRVEMPFFRLYSYYSIYYSSFKIGLSDHFPLTVTPRELSPTIEIPENNKHTYCVTSGVIHVLSNKNAAEKLLRMEKSPYLWSSIHHFAILKGYIPIGTSYFEGDSNDLAATKIIFEKEEEICV
jgi:hypothetical protein